MSASQKKNVKHLTDHNRVFNFIQKSFMATLIFFFLGLSLPPCTFADDRTTVTYQYRGHSKVIHGKKINDHTFIFNEGAPKKIKMTTLDWPP